MTVETQRIECKRLFDNAFSIGHDPQSWHTWKRAFDLGVIFGTNTVSGEKDKRIADLEKEVEQMKRFLGSLSKDWED